MKNAKSVDITLDNPDKKELDILQKLAGIYAECKGKYYDTSLEFKNSNNLVLDFSKFSKGTFCNIADSNYSIVFYKCKDISIKTLPTDFGENASDNICIYDGSTIKSLPKDMGSDEIIIGAWKFTNKNVDTPNLSALEGSKFGMLLVDDSYIAESDMQQQIMIRCRNGQYRLIQRYNDRFAEIANLKIDVEKIVCILVLDSYEYAEYDKRLDAYIFNKK